VFRDLGFRRKEAEHLLVRADLMIQVQKLITSRCLKQREAAKVLKVSQPRVSDLLRGRIDLFSPDALIDMLARLGVRVRLSVIDVAIDAAAPLPRGVVAALRDALEESTIPYRVDVVDLAETDLDFRERSPSSRDCRSTWRRSSPGSRP
jgi:predicted XRE-type DNA-binding protein